MKEDILRLANELGLNDHVTSLGPLNDAVRVLAGCDVFVLASNQEGLPVAIMEALALGLPIVATDVGGIHDEFRNESLVSLVPPTRPDLLADAIGKLLASEELRLEMSESSLGLCQRSAKDTTSDEPSRLSKTPIPIWSAVTSELLDSILWQCKGDDAGLDIALEDRRRASQPCRGYLCE